MTWALATGDLQQIPCRLPPLIRRGTQPFSFSERTEAPIARRGSMIRFMGRLRMELSPSSVLSKDCPARIPEIMRVVVPLFPV